MSETSPETSTEGSSRLTYAWIGLTMASLLVLALYVFNAQNNGDNILYTGLLLGLATIIGAVGVGTLKHDGLGVVLLRFATIVAIVGILSFML
jgi:hypothetical protein